MSDQPDDEPTEVKEFLYELDNKQHVVKRADSFIRMACGDDDCELIHIISLNDAGEPIVETTFTPDQLLRLLGFERSDLDDSEEEDTIGEVKGTA
jgi:hypothetical protein